MEHVLDTLCCCGGGSCQEPYSDQPEYSQRESPASVSQSFSEKLEWLGPQIDGHLLCNNYDAASTLLYSIIRELHASVPTEQRIDLGIAIARQCRCYRERWKKQNPDSESINYVCSKWEDIYQCCVDLQSKDKRGGQQKLKDQIIAILPMSDLQSPQICEVAGRAVRAWIALITPDDDDAWERLNEIRSWLYFMSISDWFTYHPATLICWLSCFAEKTEQLEKGAQEPVTNKPAGSPPLYTSQAIWLNNLLEVEFINNPRLAECLKALVVAETAPDKSRLLFYYEQAVSMLPAHPAPRLCFINTLLCCQHNVDAVHHYYQYKDYKRRISAGKYDHECEYSRWLEQGVFRPTLKKVKSLCVEACIDNSATVDQTPLPHSWVPVKPGRHYGSNMTAVKDWAVRWTAAVKDGERLQNVGARRRFVQRWLQDVSPEQWIAHAPLELIDILCVCDEDESESFEPDNTQFAHWLQQTLLSVKDKQLRDAFFHIVMSESSVDSEQQHSYLRPAILADSRHPLPWVVYLMRKVAEQDLYQASCFFCFYQIVINNQAWTYPLPDNDDGLFAVQLQRILPPLRSLPAPHDLVLYTPIQVTPEELQVALKRASFGSRADKQALMRLLFCRALTMLPHYDAMVGDYGTTVMKAMSLPLRSELLEGMMEYMRYAAKAAGDSENFKARGIIQYELYVSLAQIAFRAGRLNEGIAYLEKLPHKEVAMNNRHYYLMVLLTQCGADLSRRGYNVTFPDLEHIRKLVTRLQAWSNSPEVAKKMINALIRMNRQLVREEGAMGKQLRKGHPCDVTTVGQSTEWVSDNELYRELKICLNWAWNEGLLQNPVPDEQVLRSALETFSSSWAWLTGLRELLMQRDYLTATGVYLEISDKCRTFGLCMQGIELQLQGCVAWVISYLPDCLNNYPEERFIKAFDTIAMMSSRYDYEGKEKLSKDLEWIIKIFDEMLILRCTGNNYEMMASKIKELIHLTEIYQP